ncbi:Nitric oxide-associated protein 1 [Portunus trituberculatus]|uniref:Nitric oxide-associated protein 1 n=1 Tax=Portunus trituberculatus TaxID=210409 RepID=A0A5B7G392_PORTR|nr:Nitric oxide-associated protein 1 [Portunus trituberculatus]
MIHLLTHKELMKVLPCHLLHPETFCLQSGYSLLLAGLARLDLLYSPASVRSVHLFFYFFIFLTG